MAGMRIWHYALGLILAGKPFPAHTPPPQGKFLHRVATVDGTTYRYSVFLPAGWTATRTWPVVLSLHGGGGYGSDGIKQATEGLGRAIQRHPERFPVLAVFPQVPPTGPGWQGVGAQVALLALDQTIEEFSGDSAQVALTGLSIGGNGAWYLAFHNPRRFSGLLVVCGFAAERMGTMYPILYPSLVPGVADPSTALAAQIRHIPIWIFHGTADRTVPVDHSRRIVAALRALDAPVRYSELPGVDHDAWDQAYEMPEVAQWLRHPGAQGRALTDE